MSAPTGDPTVSRRGDEGHLWVDSRGSIGVTRTAGIGAELVQRAAVSPQQAVTPRNGPAGASKIGLVARAAAPGFGRSAGNAEDAEIVLGGRNPGGGEPLNQPAEAVDLALPLWTLGQQDVWSVLGLYRAR